MIQLFLYLFYKIFLILPKFIFNFYIFIRLYFVYYLSGTFDLSDPCFIYVASTSFWMQSWEWFWKIIYDFCANSPIPWQAC